MLRKILIVVAFLISAAAGALWYALRNESRPPVLSEGARCRLGAYRLEGGEAGPGLAYVRQREGEVLRLVFEDGSNLRLQPDLGESYRIAEGEGKVAFDCQAGTMTIERSGRTSNGKRIALAERPISFTSHDVSLRGKIVEPAGGVKPAAYVALVHGSEHSSAIFGYDWQYILAAHGIGVVVYDKRGTGLSEGKYSQDFHLLSDDTVAALAELRRQVPGDYQVGALGASQGGWIAPLAATKTKMDFVIALYGLAESPLAEDRDEVLLGLKEAGFGDEETRRKALEVTAATGKVMASDYQSGWEELAAVKEKYGKEPFFEHLDGEFTGDFTKNPPWALRRIGPLYDEGTSWEYEPLPTLEKIEVDHLWVLAGDDHEAPSARTREILLELQQKRPKLDLAYFPRADHGMLIFDSPPPGAQPKEPRTWRYVPGYHRLVVDWIESRRLPAGNAELVVSSGLEDLPAPTPAPAAAQESPAE
jgi:dienelactone hydrolase